MTDSGGANGESANGNGHVAASAPRRPRPKAFAKAAPPVRRTERIAEEAQLRARLELARVLGDTTEEIATGKKLALRLASRDVEIDSAIALATRTLGVGDDPELRHALAGWLEGVGEPGLAASELRKLKTDDDPAAAAALLVRIGVLHARAGDVVGAQDALEEAAKLDPSDALPLELLGAIAAPGTGLAGDGADAYVRAAKRRAAQDDADGELEDLYRAFETDPASPIATAALVAAYEARSRGSAADEVLRAHASAITDAGPVSKMIEAALEGTTSQAQTHAAEVHARRRQLAIERGDVARALAAALDENLDAEIDGSASRAIDDLLVRAGAYETLAVHMEVRAERMGAGRSASLLWAELGRLLSGTLASSERAIEAYARAVAADASATDAVHALRGLAQKASSTTWLFEGLVRGALGDAAFGASAEASSRVAAARALAESADAASETMLALWAHSVVARFDVGDERARAGAERHHELSRGREEEIERATKAALAAPEERRTGALVELAALLRSVPDHSRQFADVLVELASRDIENDALWSEAVMVAERVSDFGAVARLCRLRLARQGAPPRVRIAFVAALRRGGDLAAAAEAAGALFDACTPWAYSVAWVTAAIAHDRITRARALAALAPTCNPAVVAELAAVASEQLLKEGDAHGARRAAEQGSRADSEDARVLLALAASIPSHEQVIATTAYEQAAKVAGPSAALATKLAAAYDAMGDMPMSVSWARRAVALRPGDGAAMDTLLDRAARAGDAASLADALAWLLPQPQPARVTAERLAPALRTLAERDAPRAALLSRRALDVLGPRHPALRAAIEAVADAANDAALRARLVERWIAAGAPAAERGSLLLELARHHGALGDVDRELAAYARAAQLGVDLAAARARIDALAANLSPDAELAWLEANAELLIDEGHTDRAAAAFRDLGAALWDMADDRPRALTAWLRAAQLDSARGYATLRRDLTAFANERYAVDCLSELVEREGDRSRAGIIATEAARSAFEAGAYGKALTLARIALERHPSHAEGLEIAERASERIGRMQEMSPLYDQAARGALGRFGRRAAHHRAARFYEETVPMLALKHAAQAFIAVPSEGTTLALLSRTADRAQRRAVAVRTVEHVADLARTPGLRAAWLLRAATLTGRDLEGARQRTDLLLKAAVLSPAPVTLSMLAVAARELVSLAPDDAVAVATRLERANDSLAKSLEGPDGARIAITFAEMALDLFSDAAWAWRSIDRALGADADVDEYVRLMPFAEALARAENASASLAAVVTAIEKPYSNVGVALLRLVGAVAAAMGDGPRSVRAFVQAAEREPDDDVIVTEADTAMSRHPDPALTERLSKKVGIYRRSEALRAVATSRLEKGDAAGAVALLERALALAPSDAKSAVEDELKAALKQSGRGEEAVLRDLAAPELTPQQRAERWVELAKAREEKGDHAGATDALLQAATDDPTEHRWEAVEKAAESCGREHIRVQALQQLVNLAEAAARRAVLKRLARAEGARGSLSAAEEAWRTVLVLDPADKEADVAIEALLVARSSYDDLAEHLARRASRLAAAGGETETLRAVRLRRAAILEQRLSRLEEAAAELELLLRESPGHASALRWLADLWERAGQPSRALDALNHLASTSTETSEQENIAVRRVRALLPGDVEGARQALAPFLGRKTSAAVMEARVLVARESHDPVELGDALEDLARVSPDDARVRSEMLVEAAQAAARAGDTERSLSRARDAAKLAPDIASTQLFARGLEYRLRGAGSFDDARATVAALSRLAGDSSLEPEDVALRAFLLAEAEDIVEAGSGERTLRECVTSVGAQPLVALALAERAVTSGRVKEAVELFADALAGNLLGLRRPGRVALEATDAAEHLGDSAAALRFVNEAAKDPETRVEALHRLARLSKVGNDLPRARSVLRSLAASLDGGERAEVLAQLARLLFESPSPADRLEADRTMREAIEGAPADLAEELREQLDSFRARPPPSSSHMLAARDAGRPASSGAMPASSRVPPSAEPHAASTTQPLAKPAAGAASVVPTVREQAAIAIATATEEPIASVRHPPLAVPTISLLVPNLDAGAPAGAPKPETEARDLSSGPPDTHPTAREPSKVVTLPGPAPAPPAPAPVPPRLASERPPAQPSAQPPATSREREIPIPPRSDPYAERVTLAREKLGAGARDEAERILAEALREGSIAAADALDALFAGDPARSGLLLKVRRQAVELQPGDTTRLEALREAARLDHNSNYVRAIDHVLRAFDAQRGPLAPPPLSAQNVQPGMLGLLTRHSREASGEIFQLVWEGAPLLFAKSPQTYGMATLERIVPGPTTTLSRLFDAALRLLDTPRFSLLHKRASGPLQLTVALVAPPAAILVGDAKDDSRDVRWMLGQAIACVLPQNLLPAGLSPLDSKMLWEVLGTAFGPRTQSAELRARPQPSHARLAEDLWQTLPGKSQRRLQELLASNEHAPLELALERARQSGRRIGMFLTGDFAHAARALVAEYPLLDGADLERPGGLARLAAELPALADLYRLAVRPEYADARWHVPPPLSQRFPFNNQGGSMPV
ncbi:MAG: hypothetical protein JST00_07925 [Deltaproteobacteria bacterium]|nr:hypothetical protein [Deltaproteobacteria bacterium]